MILFSALIAESLQKTPFHCSGLQSFLLSIWCLELSLGRMTWRWKHPCNLFQSVVARTP
ncbi:hypothetical protein SLEP1_g38520 [Rubroshorea leprosula]|nr:hypothetical protein SLEP1_g38520 [Rubroshorea leprosula]